MSGIVSLHAEIRDLKKLVAAEHQARTIAEHNLGYIRDQLRIAQERLALMEGKKAIGSRKKLVEHEIRSSKTFQDLENEKIQLTQELDSLSQKSMALHEAMSKGRWEVSKQLLLMIEEANLQPARREHYEALVEGMGIYALMELHRNMRFIDDAG